MEGRVYFLAFPARSIFFHSYGTHTHTPSGRQDHHSPLNPPHSVFSFLCFLIFVRSEFQIAMVSAFAKLAPKTHPVPLILTSLPNSTPTFFKIPSHSSAARTTTTFTRPLFSPAFVLKDDNREVIPTFDQDEIEEEEEEDMREGREDLLYSFTPLPFLLVAALPGAGAVKSLFGPFVELVQSWNLPDWLVHWGHPGNMAVVLFAMGGYGTYLGFRIRFSEDLEEKAKAKDLHPKLLGGMFFFFALGATGGITSLLTSDRPIFESPHAVTAFIGLALLTIQTILPSLFEGNPGLRNVHGILGSGIMTLFLIHAALGLQLGLSY